jgi:predicted membrane protein
VFSVAAISKQALLSVLSIAGLPMLLFSLLLLLHYSRFVEYPTKNIAFFLKFLVFMLKTAFLIPFVVFLYPLPFFSAFVKYSLGYYKKRELV